MWVNTKRVEQNAIKFIEILLTKDQADWLHFGRQEFEGCAIYGSSHHGSGYRLVGIVVLGKRHSVLSELLLPNGKPTTNGNLRSRDF